MAIIKREKDKEKAEATNCIGAAAGKEIRKELSLAGGRISFDKTFKYTCKKERPGRFRRRVISCVGSSL
ncbi:hypothetical protein CHS0354_016348 [Potamilus streckersoni]|uniref:Uncharacterized protein n=1 Tax=Potamilus streckersoni TaxID=2493646 RepID=A0AAE0SMF8_9BIVA|nr:hypothetical protein CHS0354_016348 [Potamilus streckersoni]